MCNYSLEHIASERGVASAKKNDHLTIAGFHGFEHKDRSDGPVVCLLPGTELSLTGKAIDFYMSGGGWGDRETVDCRNEAVKSEERRVPILWRGGVPEDQNMDILVRSDGRYAIIHHLPERSTVRVLQLPVVASSKNRVSMPEPLLEHA